MTKTNTITRRGAERLIAIADLIERTGAFSYGHWYVDEGGGELDDHEGAEKLAHGACGTSGCIGGWAAALALQEGDITTEELHDRPISYIAREWLQINESDTFGELFYGGSLYEWRGEVPDGDGYDDEDERHWTNATPVEVAKMLRDIANGDHPTWRVIE